MVVPDDRRCLFQGDPPPRCTPLIFGRPDLTGRWLLLPPVVLPAGGRRLEPECSGGTALSLSRDTSPLVAVSRVTDERALGHLDSFV